MKRYLKDVDPAVFWGSAVLIAGFVGWGLLAPKSLGSVMSTALDWVIGNFGWAFIVVATGVLLLCIYLAASPWGKLRRYLAFDFISFPPRLPSATNRRSWRKLQ